MGQFQLQMTAAILSPCNLNDLQWAQEADTLTYCWLLYRDQFTRFHTTTALYMIDIIVLLAHCS